MSKELTIAVLGGGSFGTAVANILAVNGHHTWLWMRDAERAARCQMQRENPEYLPGYALHDNLRISADLEQAVCASDVVFISVPSKSFREVTRQVAPLLRPDTIVISTTKGIEPEGFTLMSQILEQELSDARIGVLSGPNFAREIVQQQQTGTVIASDDETVIKSIQTALSSPTFRVYANRDRYGVELGGALKNIYAIVSGLATAVGCGHNTHAMLLTRSLAEMGRFARELGADPMTFLGLAGVGDLILTCTSDLSRNYRVGQAIGQGKTLEQAVAEIGQVAEGVNTVRIVKQKADEMGVYMPLVTGMYAILFDSKPLAEVATGLMMGEQNYDVEYSRKS
ncbi:NAD(P)H-dependent glycerol-3-phosphate dehydrogenase [Pseudomaricurvus alkylphenolicus]|jgi:glycerol-3-phosphate dehydrogenase (NAD(P)+)|uniref:NAD(P)H-dependent glycerol-3-phosphate dehydrogenase n=1 Tax=Pseudomaricurvus alkylphenolicus TaxID=1306991 RepID=UPI00141FA52E|nr:NAD(P)H-dependent glycerol-3-phosphate dehydrogenase [Pseudomaricurvus alkylphenolicus]NIB41350.1 NAD(P)H-dependent glycerol-3-phosphate dehydrogenase [Pseudomaricurvus alkylphenolicus]